jgi:hypothetical protein
MAPAAAPPCTQATGCRPLATLPHLLASHASPYASHPLPGPAANVTLGFSYPVVLSALQSSLTLASCCKRDDAMGRSVRVLPCGPPFRFADPFAPAAAEPMAQNSTCAVVRIVPGLRAGEVVSLTLPAGAPYNPVAGRPKKALETYLWGLRRFRIPLRDNFRQLTGPSEPFDFSDQGITYRRMTAWLPHGLDPAVKIPALAAQISLCRRAGGGGGGGDAAGARRRRPRVWRGAGFVSWACRRWPALGRHHPTPRLAAITPNALRPRNPRYADPYKWTSNCQNVKFDLNRVDGGKLVMVVPSFDPRQHYHLKVKANPAVRRPCENGAAVRSTACGRGHKASCEFGVPACRRQALLGAPDCPGPRARPACCSPRFATIQTQIKDGFGLPLEASEAFFFTTEPGAAMSGPALAGGGSLMVLEADAKAAPLRWPIASRGKPQSDTDAAGAVAWSIAPRSYPDAMRLTSSYDFNLAPTKLGTASERRPGPPGAPRRGLAAGARAGRRAGLGASRAGQAAARGLACARCEV